MMIPRSPWPAGFPDVVLHTTVRSRNDHADYEQAKAGDRRAAVRLVSALVDQQTMDRLHRFLVDRDPILLPVHAIETRGINFIPEAYAAVLSEASGCTLMTEIVQTNVVRHTRASGFHRLAFQPTFGGEVIAGRQYVLVDDHFGLGGTLANLKGHVESNGGTVIATTTLTSSRNNCVLALHRKTLQDLRRKHGDALEQFWQQSFGHGLDNLTEPEAAYLLRAGTVDAIRDRLAQALSTGLQAGL
jgi:hypothetical protein